MPLTIQPMPVGAEVLGFAEGMERDSSVQQALYRAWLDHGILLFRGVETVDQHLAIGREGRGHRVTCARAQR